MVRFVSIKIGVYVAIIHFAIAETISKLKILEEYRRDAPIFKTRSPQRNDLIAEQTTNRKLDVNTAKVFGK